MHCVRSNLNCVNNKVIQHAHLDTMMDGNFVNNVIDFDDNTLVLPVKPVKPSESDCCGQGCIPCVFDIYEQELKIWEEECRKIALGRDSENSEVREGGPVLKPMEYSVFVVQSLKQETKDSYRFRISLPPGATLGMAIGQHLIIRGMVGEELVTRQYTPITNVQQKSYFDLLIKVYPEGKMSRYVSTWQVGTKVEMRGPYGNFTYRPNQLESLDLDASAKSEISVSRSSSLIANLSGYDDDDADAKDLFILVDDPEKHTGTMDTYVTFRITTKTTRSEFDDSEYQVRRRYNDFLWLRQKLEETYPTHLVPPLPEKHTLRRLDRFSPEFLRVRQTALQKFLIRLADHPVLSFNKDLQIFLTAKAWEFQAHKKQGTGLISRVSDSIHNIGSSYMLKNRNPDFAIMQEYILTFGEKLAVMDRVTQRVVKEQTEYLSVLMDWGPIYTLWSNSEDTLTPALLAMSKAVDHWCQALKELVDSTEDNFAQPLKEYTLYTDAIKAVLKRRDVIQAEYDMTVDELNKKKDEREQLKISDQTYSIGAFLGKDPDEVKQQKQEKVDQQIEELTHQMEALNDKTVCSDTDLKADMERWHKNKHRDMKEIFLSWADRNVKYYEKCLSVWENAIRVIQAKDPGTEPLQLNTQEDQSLLTMQDELSSPITMKSAESEHSDKQEDTKEERTP